MVPAGVLGHVAQVRGPGQLLEHLDRGDDVVVDGVAVGCATVEEDSPVVGVQA